MKITFYKNSAEVNKLDKSSQLEEVIEMEGTLRNASSITRPSIVIEVFDKDYVIKKELPQSKVIDDSSNKATILTADKLVLLNYCYIEEFNRYYFINDITSVAKGLWLVDMSVDVLMTYKDKILDLSAFVTRNEFTFNANIKDDLVSFYYDKEIRDAIPDKGPLVNTTFDVDPSVESRYIVLSVINQRTNQVLQGIESPDEGFLPNIDWNAYQNLYTNIVYALLPEDLKHLSLELAKDDNKASFIKSLIMLPFNPHYHTPLVDVYLGNSTIPTDITEQNLKGYLLDNKISDYLIIADFTLTPDHESFLDYLPYTQYELFLPYNGWITLTAEQILNNNIIVYYTVNYEDCSSNVYVYDVTNHSMLYSGTSQIGVKLPIDTTNNTEVTAQRNANGLNLGLGLVSSALSIGTGALSGNPLAVAGGILSAGKGIASYVNNESMIFDKAQSTFSSGVAGLYTSQDVHIKITTLKPKEYNSNYAKLHGKPLNEYVSLDSLTGFTVVGNVHLENFDTATSQEINEIDALLKDGIII